MHALIAKAMALLAVLTLTSAGALTADMATPLHDAVRLVRTLASPVQLHGRVVGVTDGDTITVLDSNMRRHIVRLSGIDAPEKAQPFGNRAKSHMASLVFNQNVIVTVRMSSERHGRVLGLIHDSAGKDINLAMIEAGYAWHAKAFERDQPPKEARAYAQAEQQAMSSKTGLWQDAHPIAPSDWRKAHRSPAPGR